MKRLYTLLTDDSEYVCRDEREFVAALRADVIDANDSDQEFMDGIAERAEFATGCAVRSDDAVMLVADLVAAGILSVTDLQ